ncbi:mannose-1-phosphate guanylyltransferase/mannose-6-phosphate isomerase [Pseudomonas sp. MH9.2]|uniref:mannose-1-phosphate guanylyltransferase/mannose-6-phosphate isomerase n=1 Tax=unclassified Pseudomonas TaxID=196821 RepID=UPI002AC91A82|nr:MULTISPECIES: mannose-1-phosphate guanylyltransferase/mannose-6-phosphate isomerase [unclassified Pseudomonas]MEB0007379.1 mannose-1-phosphate guanylyltransferase/mannose-6-phosphate isomerase [Pseudomonas sp. RTB2]MEB0015797.1 mannose-1-phosphate guanylyltransferase/mannose-6-phosphate isomerase [Pseudomonas sp. RTB3]MEB0026166.1 mannose-1-phosphate guanylyltransferase/mannose-6-phosphate isomerase [Pseudomonas sp. MH9.2]MEB0146782.1 mannose-1-phosphate guanylyltransferase/mannose-6-phospha
MSTLIPCIIAGGAGTRLWPVSREAMPKPFMRLPDGESLLQKTFVRAVGLADVDRILTVTNRDVYFRTVDDYRQLNKNHVSLDFILEPFGRNTAPAIAAAALHVARLYGDDAHLLILPADHLIKDVEAFAQAVSTARELADQGWMVTFGIVPTKAETGFGYIEKGQSLNSTATAYQVARFVEKPDADTAQGYLDGGLHLWNGGMFCMRADTILRELQEHAPQVLASVKACLERSPSKEGNHELQLELDSELFALAPDISIDYAVMEPSQKVAVVPCQLGWSDIGSWQAMRELSPADTDGNQCNGQTVLHEVTNCYIDSPRRLVGGVGLDNLIIIDTPDALLIADANRSQDVRIIAKELKRQGHDAYRLHRTVTRPWGTYTVLEEGKRFKIKRIMVRPQASLSLQMHHHRSEHWIVVSGMARVTNGDSEFLLDTNESTFIKPGRTHRLINPGVVDLVMIEVQSGEYLGEDDIVRFTDVYGRVPVETLNT